jgi:hypothetical protein
MPYRLIFFLTIYEAFLAYLAVGVCFYIRVTMGVTGGA